MLSERINGGNIRRYLLFTAPLIWRIARKPRHPAMPNKPLPNETNRPCWCQLQQWWPYNKCKNKRPYEKNKKRDHLFYAGQFIDKHQAAKNSEHIRAEYHVWIQIKTYSGNSCLHDIRRRWIEPGLVTSIISCPMMSFMMNLCPSDDLVTFTCSFPRVRSDDFRTASPAGLQKVFVFDSLHIVCESLTKKTFYVILQLLPFLIRYLWFMAPPFLKRRWWTCSYFLLSTTSRLTEVVPYLKSASVFLFHKKYWTRHCSDDFIIISSNEHAVPSVLLRDFEG